MGLSKEQLLARLKELEIDFSQYDHPVVLTVEAQDKKSRFYIVSALADTKVDLKVLSVRLGLGKGGLRMAPEEALGEILQVPLGSVTPLSLVNESARNVSLLLDQKFKSQKFCFFHPLSNDMSISLTTTGLDKFLKSIKRDPSYVDLEANPSVGKDQPPDLASLVPSSSVVLPDPLETAACYYRKQSFCVQQVDKKCSKHLTSVSATKSQDKPANITDVGKLVDDLLESTSSLLLKEVTIILWFSTISTLAVFFDVLTKIKSLQITEKNFMEHGEGLGEELSRKIKGQLAAELHNTVMIFKNTAYTEGFHAGMHCHPKRSY
ncbi:hypothetical protein ACLB2K_014394 [Fragaria x ananassa]